MRINNKRLSETIIAIIMLKQKALNPVEIRSRAFALHIHTDIMLVSASPNELFPD